MPNSDALDHILEVVAPALHTIATDHVLRQSRIDQWRWDQPEVVLSWIDQDKQNIGKNIRFSLDDEDGVYLCTVEVNAWLDELDRGQPVRRWRHELINAWRVRRPDEVSVDRGPLTKSLVKAYDTIAQWELTDLTNAHYPRLASTR